jgi:hypothetical protein
MTISDKCNKTTPIPKENVHIVDLGIVGDYFVRANIEEVKRNNNGKLIILKSVTEENEKFVREQREQEMYKTLKEGSDSIKNVFFSPFRKVYHRLKDEFYHITGW